MMGKPVSASAATPIRPEASAMIQGLERLRDGLLQRLDQIEIQAMEQAQWLAENSSDREKALRERLSALEAANARLQAEVKRREQEWLDVLDQLESDRRLLAEAWERLEEEQLETPRSSPRSVLPVAAPAEDPSPPRAHRVATDNPADDVVSRAILREFQALQGDVRRNAK